MQKIKHFSAVQLTVKTTSITRLRADATRLVQELRAGADEPVLVLQGSDVAAVLVSPKLWNDIEAELKRLRKRNRELFWDGVEDAELQVAAGQSTPLDTGALLGELGLTRDDAA
jgi:PHD/YefM family antitoxin component YafN of YafNO toxin-antitoxin module